MSVAPSSSKPRCRYTKECMSRQLRAFYEKYNREKLGMIEDIVVAYLDDFKLLEKQLFKKYDHRLFGDDDDEDAEVDDVGDDAWVHVETYTDMLEKKAR